MWQLLFLLDGAVFDDHVHVSKSGGVLDTGTVDTDFNKRVAARKGVDRGQTGVKVQINVVQSFQHSQFVQGSQLVLGALEGNQGAVLGKRRKLRDLIIREIQSDQARQRLQGGDIRDGVVGNIQRRKRCIGGE